MNTDPDRPACTCSFLHQAATDPKQPIVFDSELNEFHIEFGDGYSMIYFCPICGGRTPTSLRRDLFAIVTQEEEDRLHALNQEFRSVEDLTNAFGPPDKERQTFTFKNISSTANVVAMVENNEWRGIYFHQKQLKRINSPEAEQAVDGNPH